MMNASVDIRYFLGNLRIFQIFLTVKGFLPVGTNVLVIAHSTMNDLISIAESLEMTNVQLIVHY